MIEIDSCAIAIEELADKDFAFDSSDFSDVVRTKAFVDKTLLIKAIFQGSSKIEINAPPRFGKSTNMDMLKKFVEIHVDERGAVIDRLESYNYDMFRRGNLLIYQDRDFFNEYFATYPVLYVDFKPVTGNSYAEILNKFRVSLHETFKLHPYLLQSDKLDLGEKQRYYKYWAGASYMNLSDVSVTTGLEFLAGCLYKHFNNKGVFVLIDEYDAPVNNMMQEYEFIKVSDLLGGMLCDVLKGNEYVHRALLTGVSSFVIGTSAPDNLVRHMFLDTSRYVQFYGLTEPEVDALFCKFNIDEEMKKKVHAYYNGYSSVNNEKLFSICSVLHYLQNEELKSYWQPCDMGSILKNSLTVAYLRYSIEELCSRNSLEIEVLRNKNFYDAAQLLKICLRAGPDLYVNPDRFFSFLLERGYLTYEKAIKSTFGLRYTLKIPNSEIFDELQEQLKEYYGPSVNSCLDACADIFKEISTNSEDEIFKNFISKFNRLLKELHITAIQISKATCRYLLFNILCKAKYSIGGELHVAEGNPYFIFYKDCLAIIIEVTYAQTVDVALEDIVVKYVNVIEEELCLKKATARIYMGLNINAIDTAIMKVLVNWLKLTKAKTF